MEDTTTKKTYINPEIEIDKLKAQQLLAGSTLGIDESVEITDESKLLSRDFDFDDEEDW